MNNKWKDFRRKTNGADPSVQLELDYNKLVSLIPSNTDGNYNKHKSSFKNSIEAFINQ